MYGRGAGDMKAGLAAMVGAVRGAALAGAGAGRAGDAAVGGRGGVRRQRRAGLPAGRPYGRRRRRGRAVRRRDHHLAGRRAVVRRARWRACRRTPPTPAAGNNAIEAMVPVIARPAGARGGAERGAPAALRRLSAPDQPERRRDPRAATGRPPWPASAAPGSGWRSYPGESVEALRERIEAAVAAAAADTDAYLAEHPPVVSYDGFACEGYAIAADEPLVTALSATYARQAEAAPALIAHHRHHRRAHVRAARRHPQRLLRARTPRTPTAWTSGCTCRPWCRRRRCSRCSSATGAG